MAKKTESAAWSSAVQLSAGGSCDMTFPDGEIFSVMPSGGSVEANGEVKHPNAAFQCSGQVKFVALTDVSLEVRRVEPQSA